MTTIMDIAEGVLVDLAKVLGNKNRTPAVMRVVTEFMRRKKACEFVHLIRLEREHLTSGLNMRI